MDPEGVGHANKVAEGEHWDEAWAEEALDHDQSAGIPEDDQTVQAVVISHGDRDMADLLSGGPQASAEALQFDLAKSGHKQ